MKRTDYCGRIDRHHRGQTITLKGVDAAALGSANFQFNVEAVTTNTGTMTIGNGDWSATLALLIREIESIVQRAEHAGR